MIRTPGFLVSVGTLLFHLATAKGYGYFRDELYYLANAEHLAFGYVDHPPLIGLIAWLTRATLGDSLYAIRFLPAVAAAGTVYLTAAMAREMGGARWAQLLSALAAALAPIYLSLFTILSMNAFDVLFWAGAAYLFIRILNTGELRLWIPFGIVTGIALQNKISVLFLGFGVAAGLLAARDFKHFKSAWFWAGGILSLAIFAPHVAWQAAHGWPTREFIANASQFKNAPLAILDFMKEQVLMLNPAFLPLWGAGLLYVLLSPGARLYRALGFTYVAVLIVMLTQNAKAYYLSPIYTMLFASGAVALERLDSRIVRPLAPIVVVLAGVLLAPFGKPLLPIDTYVRYAERMGIRPSSGERHRLGRLPQFFADMQGWPELARSVADVFSGLSAEDRARACVFGQNYGEAGAIDFFGPALGLPKALSGHNTYFLWGPRDCKGDVVVVIGGDESDQAQAFAEARRAATFTCADCMPYENNLPIWVCRGLRAPISQVWPQVKHFE